MEYGIYNFADHKQGTTLNEKTFTFSAHPSGLLTDVILTTNKGNSLKNGEGITIVDAANWTFTIDAQIINWDKEKNTYEIKTISSHGVAKEFIRGDWTII